MKKQQSLTTKNDRGYLKKIVSWGNSLLFLVTIAAVVVVGCAQPNPHSQISPISAPNDASPPAMRSVKHAMGKIQVPVNPQRIVALTIGDLANALALGVIPIGASWGTEKSALEPYRPYLHEREPADLGSMEEPNLEKILLLKPDLIVGEPMHQRIYNQLSRIAPTVLNDMSYDAWDWKETLRFTGEVLDKAQEAEKLLRDYDRRILELRQKLGNRVSTTTVSIVYLDSSSISFLLKDSLAGMILQDIGLPRPRAQAKRGAYGDIAFSFESILQMDGDVIFLISPEDRDSLNFVKKLKAQPLWSRLEAVQRDKVYSVDVNYWTSWNVIAANLILDDLSKYLLEE
jgi:iron complex transport system substrate-binding protein